MICCLCLNTENMQVITRQHVVFPSKTWQQSTFVMIWFCKLRFAGLCVSYLHMSSGIYMILFSASEITFGLTWFCIELKLFVVKVLISLFCRWLCKLINIKRHQSNSSLKIFSSSVSQEPSLDRFTVCLFWKEVFSFGLKLTEQKCQLES